MPGRSALQKTTPRQATSSTDRAAFAPKYPTARPVIWDTDWYTDVDDVVAARVLDYYERIGKVDVLACIIDTIAPNGATSLDSFWRAAGRPMQIGQVPYSFSDLSSGGPYQTNMAANTIHIGADASAFPSSTIVYRTALANATGKVDIIAVGYMAALWALLQSPADAISPLTGVQLVTAKVGKLWVMGGTYPSGTENNFSRSALSISAAQYVVNNWPTSVPITFSGYEVGFPVTTGANLATLVPTNDVVYKALVDHGSINGRNSWDPMATLLACIGDETAAGYTTVTGTNVVNADGSNTFTAGAGGPHKYVVKNQTDATFAATINGLLVPGRQPIPDDTARVSWSRARGGLLPPITGTTVISPVTLVAAMKAAGTDGAAVSTVAATTGPAWNQATGAKQPTYRASVAGTQGGSSVNHAALQFSGAQELVSAANIASGAGMTVVARVMWASVPGANQCIAASDQGSGSTRLWHLKAATNAKAEGVTFNSGTGTVDDTVGLVIQANTWHLVALRYDGSSLEALVDGVSNGATATTAASTGSIPVTIGARDTTMAEPLTGYIAEVRIYSGKATDAQLASLTADM
jgi:hypothetical protein